MVGLVVAMSIVLHGASATQGPFYVCQVAKGVKSALRGRDGFLVNFQPGRMSTPRFWARQVSRQLAGRLPTVRIFRSGQGPGVTLSQSG